MIKKEQIIRFIFNTLAYTLIGVGGYLLYNHYNTDIHNKPHTDFSFVYAQF